MFVAQSKITSGTGNSSGMPLSIVGATMPMAYGSGSGAVGSTVLRKPIGAFGVQPVLPSQTRTMMEFSQVVVPGSGEI